MNDEQGTNDGSSFILHRSSLAAGIDLFNDHQFWHAHEAWERAWLATSGDIRIFLQGLIQLAAAYHHIQRGTLAGAGRLLDAALEKMSRAPAGFLGVDREEAVARAREHRLRLEKERIDASEFPKIRYN